MFKNNNPINLNIGILFVIIFYGLALYFVPIQSKTFYFDDKTSIEDNGVIQNLDLPKIFNAFNTRFLVGLSFALNYKFCALYPEGYRLVNLLIHCLNAFLIYLLIKSTFRLAWPAFFASILFLVHPIQTEAVNFITQRFVLMGTFFYLLTLFLYVQYRCRSQRVYLIASIVSSLAAMFCKEFVVTLPLMLTLYEFYFLGSVNETICKRGARLVPFFIVVLIVPFLLLRTPSQAIGVANIVDSSRHIDITRAHNGVGRKQYFLTELNVMCTYVRLLVLPVNQNFDYDYPLSGGVDTKTVLCGVFLLAFLALAMVMYKSYRIISFSILWFFIALSVESSFIPIGHVIAEYRLYLGSVGFVFLVTALIYRGARDKRISNIMAVAVLIGLSILTFQRNKVWGNEIALWNDTIRKSPYKARAYNARGNVYSDQGKFKEAILDFSKAIELSPEYAEAYNNRGAIYFKQGRLADALTDYNKAIAFSPDYSAVYYNNRGILYFKEGDLARAGADYNRAIKINFNDAQAHYNQGLIFDRQGKFVQAILDYNKAIEVNPDYVEGYINRGTIYAKEGNFTRAISDLTKAIEINPGYAETYNNLAILYYQLKEYDKAQVYLRHAEELGYRVVPAFVSLLRKSRDKY